MAKITIQKDDGIGEVAVHPLGYTPKGLRWRVGVRGGGLPFERTAGVITRSSIPVRGGSIYLITGEVTTGYGGVNRDVVAVRQYSHGEMLSMAGEIASIWSLKEPIQEGVPMPIVGPDWPIVYMDGK